MNVILLGYRGSGKSSVGRLIGERLRWPFRDVDRLIMQRYGNRSVAEIWADEGEPHYRQTECVVTAELCAGNQQVIALGGGTAMQPAAREAIERSDALRIYLQATPEVLAQRIEGDAQSAGLRPSLTGGATGGALDEVKAVLAERESVYEAVADNAVDVSNMSVEQVVDAVLAMVPADS